VIYLDAAATTPVRREAIEAMWPFLTGEYGNPSSSHSLGGSAAAALLAARQRVAAVLNCRAGEVVFTSGGTEADNLAVKGIALARRTEDPSRTRVLVSTVDHPAVLESAAYLSRVHGFTVDTVPVDSQGLVQPGRFAQLLGPDVAVASVMYANNEVGTVQPVAELAALSRAQGIPFHTDAVQAAGWLSLDTAALGVDALSLSGHKVGAPKGVGVLYVRSRIRLEPLIHGGSQERGTRSGTENVAFAVALGTALELADRARPEQADRVAALRERFIAGVLERVPEAVLTGPRWARLPSIASFCFPGSSGESVLLELERRSIACSSGSACAAGSDEPSPVLTAMGVPAEVAQTAVRFSFAAGISAAELEAAVEAVADVLAALGRLHGPRVTA
jgi:cysteine desulfurase